jgi:hypothetical protein
MDVHQWLGLVLVLDVLFAALIAALSVPKEQTRVTFNTTLATLVVGSVGLFLFLG